ncbi:calpain 7 [Lobosporangium transversale]|nr:calpain 7 [Lobosporangium transversale]
MTPPPPGLRVIIVGGGLAGLVMGIMLDQAGIDYHILEQASRLRPLGTSISLHPVIMDLMAQLGLLEDMQKMSKPLRGISVLSANGRKMGRIDTRTNKRRHHHQAMVMSRPDLHEYLLSKIPPGKLTTGKRVIDITETQQDVTVTCMDETTYVGHIVVGADGAYSATRQIMYKKLKERGILPESDTKPLHFDKQCVVGMTSPLDPAKYPVLLDDSCEVKVLLGKDQHTSNDDGDHSSHGSGSRSGRDWYPETAVEICEDVRNFKCPYGGSVMDLIESTPKGLVSKVLLEEKMYRTWYNGRVVLVGDGVAEQEKQHEQGALDFYTDSADLFWQAWKAAPEGPTKETLKQRLNDVMGRAEDIKGVHLNTMPLLKEKPSYTPIIAGPSNLTPQELRVLKTTMVINNKRYHPWSDADVKDLLREKGPFTDPDGMLALSDKQTAKFGSWKRVSQIMENPKMICLISSTSIVQDIVTDCSFVASLCVSASYERRWKKQLIRACIYPKNKFGEPCYNPHGKYLVKLTFNGIARRVVVDDYLPVSKAGTLMCTFSTNKNELWPSIIEKAYMKLMGGYDFPGSNSGIDLYALTGWIPEHIFIKETNFDSEKQWKRMMDGQRKGVALVTIATGHMSDEEADHLGLVPTHAYAVLDLKEVQGLRLLQVKNPWSHKRWKGPFSHLDADHWTEELKKELNFDQFAALKNDDGIFWIDYESVCSTFDTIHINWNLETLNYRAVIHAPWPCNYGPKRDNYNLGYNPQFTLITNVKGSRPCVIWLLLSKHITKTEENRDFITLHVFDVQRQVQNQAITYIPAISLSSASASTSTSLASLPGQATSSLSVLSARSQGTRIYYEGNSLIKGMYVNSPHILVRFEVPSGQSEYTIVLSQHIKTRDLHFTLRAYAMCEFELREIPNKYAIERKFEDEWTEETAGGSGNNASFLNNPQYRLVVPVPPAPQTATSVLFMLESPTDYAAHVQLRYVDMRAETAKVASDSSREFADLIYEQGFKADVARNIVLRFTPTWLLRMITGTINSNRPNLKFLPLPKH